MKEKIEHFICDICKKREGAKKCIVCRKDCCVICEYGSIGTRRLCNDCSKDSKVKPILESYYSQRKLATTNAISSLEKIIKSSPNLENTKAHKGEK